jgi:hypothetical protein
MLHSPQPLADSVADQLLNIGLGRAGDALALFFQ